MRNLPHVSDLYLVNVQTMRKIAHIFVTFSKKLNFKVRKLCEELNKYFGEKKSQRIILCETTPPLNSTDWFLTRFLKVLSEGDTAAFLTIPVTVVVFPKALPANCLALPPVVLRAVSLV